MTIIYEIKKLPDLSLTKYQGLESQGVSGLISIQEGFLNLLLKYSLLNDILFSLIYKYNSDDPSGQRIKVELYFQGEEKKLTYLQKIIEANSINTYYNLEITNKIEDKCYSYCGIVTKNEKFLKDISNPFNNEEYYQVSEWKSLNTNRYMSLFNLMSLLNDDVLIRIDFKVVNFIDRIEKTVVNVNNQINSKRGNGFKNDWLSKIIKYNEDLLKRYTETTQVKACIYALASDELNVSSLLSTLCSEALENNEYNISLFNHEHIFKIENLINFESLDHELTIKKDLTGNINLCNGKTLQLGLDYLNTLFTLDEISPFFRLPILFENEIIEIPKETSNLLIKKTNEEVIDLALDENGYMVSMPINDINRHIFICGIPGSGKTTTMHRILIELYKRDIPFLVLEPAKTEYRELISMELEKIMLFSPKPNTLFEISINPFEFPIGISLSEHISNLLSIFTGAFYFPTPLPMILEEAMENIYLKQKWNLLEINNGKKFYPTLNDFYSEVTNVINEKKYSQENKDNMSGISEIRLGSLLKREKGEIFSTKISTIKPDNWINISAIIELESLDPNIANFITLLLSTYIRENLKINVAVSDSKLRHVILFEEAHNLITSDLRIGEETANIKVASTNYIIKMLAEVRALKEGIIIADQLPSAMAPEVIKNTSTKIIHKITANDELNTVAQTTNANNIQLENISVFDNGEALFDIESLIKPFKCRVINVESHGKKDLNDNQLFAIYRETNAFKYLQKCYEQKNIYLNRNEIYNFYLELFDQIYERIKSTEMYTRRLQTALVDERFNPQSFLDKYLEYLEIDEDSPINLQDELFQIIQLLLEDKTLSKCYKDEFTTKGKKCFKVLEKLIGMNDKLKECAIK